MSKFPFSYFDPETNKWVIEDPVQDYSYEELQDLANEKWLLKRQEEIDQYSELERMLFEAQDDEWGDYDYYDDYDYKDEEDDFEQELEDEYWYWQGLADHDE